MIDWIMHFQWNGWLGIFLFWSPLMLCAYGYTVRVWHMYQKDVKDRANDRIYIPNLTVGTILGYGLLTIMPIANLFAAIFDVGPKVFSGVVRFLERVFTQPLVPPLKTK
jgi:hypothetical protein